MLHGIILDQNCRSVLLNCEAEPFQSRRCAFGAAGLRRCDLTEPALERRRMAFPEAQESASRPDKLPNGVTWDGCSGRPHFSRRRGFVVTERTAAAPEASGAVESQSAQKELERPRE
jgi:hypothetical protein